jgi:hypothetical protein
MKRTGMGSAGLRAVRRLGRAGIALAMVAALVATAQFVAAPADQTVVVRGDVQAEWGGEALAAVAERAFEWAPIPVANACGIGASSCFKCHNGSRAAAPKADLASSPWHPQHKTVNNSCAGCHAGNARIIKKEIAHTGLVKDPRASSEACGKCHQAGNAADLLKSYQVASTGGK